MTPIARKRVGRHQYGLVTFCKFSCYCILQFPNCKTKCHSDFHPYLHCLYALLLDATGWQLPVREVVWRLCSCPVQWKTSGNISIFWWKRTTLGIYLSKFDHDLSRAETRSRWYHLCWVCRLQLSLACWRGLVCPSTRRNLLGFWTEGGFDCWCRVSTMWAVPRESHFCYKVYPGISIAVHYSEFWGQWCLAHLDL